MSVPEKTQALAEALAELIAEIVAEGSEGVVEEEEAAAEPEPTPARKRGKKGAKAVTVDEVRNALIALNEAKGKQAVVDVLAQFGVGKVGDLEEANYAECKQAAEEAQAAEGSAEDMFS